MTIHMNKQQLAAAIWSSANSMRSKIEASEYKDIILGLIFYKFLSSKEMGWLTANDWDADDVRELAVDEDGNIPEAIAADVEDIQRELGYFIAFGDMWDTWIAAGSDFEFKDVTDGISRFNRFVHSKHKRLFEGVFNSLSVALPKLGDTDPARCKTIRELLVIINDIPTDGRQGYDVLGFVYEYLLKQFASNAGSKAGEFYTPAAVSKLKAEIIADHLSESDEISIFDGAAGSSSLLLNIGGAVARRSGEPDKIRYYAQEYKEATYNLTRMNLIMHGIKVDNIVTRRGDTLDPNDWPVAGPDAGEDGLPPLLVSACAENPPYSQKWDAKGREDDPRFKDYGVAPKSKADYAFLLHGLYHLKPDGIMTIILPHGVLFRGGKEEEIRRNLIERDQIDAIIGLPADIFYGTGIPTLVMVLKKQRSRSDIMVIDASKGFVKAGKKNELRARDIKRAFDAYKARVDVPGYAHLATKEEVRANGYNLNIPRYVDSSEKEEPVDLYASVFGGVPAAEVDALGRYWEALPGVREAVFTGEGAYLSVAASDIREAVYAAPAVAAYRERHEAGFAGFAESLRAKLVEGYADVDAVADEDAVARDLFARLESSPLTDPYDGYQVLDDAWQAIAADVETLQAEGLDAARALDENWVTKKSDGKEKRVMEGYVGRLLPFSLVQGELLGDRFAEVTGLESKLADIASRLGEIAENLPEEEAGAPYLKEDGGGFAAKELAAALAELAADEEDPAIEGLSEYVALLDAKASKNDKLAYVEAHPEVPWGDMEPNRDGTFGKGKANALLKQLRADYAFEPETLGAQLSEAAGLMAEEKEARAQLKGLAAQLETETEERIANLTDAEALDLLEKKWIAPLTAAIDALPEAAIEQLVASCERLAAKYETTYSDICDQISGAESELSGMLGQLTGGEADMAAIAELEKLLGGE